MISNPEFGPKHIWYKIFAFWNNSYVFGNIPKILVKYQNFWYDTKILGILPKNTPAQICSWFALGRGHGNLKKRGVISENWIW